MKNNRLGKMVAGIAIVALIGVLATSTGIAEDKPFNIEQIFKQEPLQEEENELLIIRTKIKQYGLTEIDARIIEGIRKFYYTNVDIQDNPQLIATQIFVKTFQADIKQMIDWACIHFVYIHKEYDGIIPDDKKPDYIEFVFEYFYNLMSRQFQVDKKIIPQLVNFVKDYIKANYKNGQK